MGTSDLASPVLDTGRWSRIIVVRCKTMLTTEELARIHPTDEALLAFPQAIALTHNILPVAMNGTRMHFIVPKPALGIDDPISETIRTNCTLDFTLEYGPADELERLISYFYDRLQATVSRCGRWFRFRCPKEWKLLSPTSEVGVRFCGVCQQKVYFAATEEELRKLASEGRCAAFYDYLGDCLVGMLNKDPEGL